MNQRHEDAWKSFWKCKYTRVIDMSFFLGFQTLKHCPLWHRGQKKQIKNFLQRKERSICLTVQRGVWSLVLGVKLFFN